MKKVLYVSNIEVPYRVRMFNELSRYCELTVMYERSNSDTRNDTWSKSISSSFKKIFLDGFKIGAENSVSLKAFKEIFGNYDIIVLGCFNSPLQILMLLFMRTLNKPYYLNLDGEVFADGKNIKSCLKRFFLKGAYKYLVAGEKSAESLRRIITKQDVVPYYFSSLSQSDLDRNALAKGMRERYVLVVGQYQDYKGMDVAFKAAQKNTDIRYKFIGMGKKTDDFKFKYCPDGQCNVEFIPFLQKEDLENEYRKCSAFVLPSRQECWGLVINEAASFGTPIVSTKGSGAAVEFLENDYPQFLSDSDNPDSLYNCIESLLRSDNTEYSRFLLNKSRNYSIEKSVTAHLRAFGIEG